MKLVRRFVLALICLCSLLMMFATGFAANNNAEWYWISSDDKYSKFYAPAKVQVIRSFGHTAVQISAWTKTNYSYAGAKETLDNYGLDDIKPNDLVYSVAEVEVVPSAIGWSEMSDGWPKRFAEWNSMNGNGGVVDLSGRKTTFASTHENNPVLTQEEADAYSDMTNMFGDWIPTMATEQAPVPTGVTVNGSTLSWTGSDYALLYAICKDGDVIDFVTTTSYEVTEDGSYTVRAANEMGGLSEPSEAASVTTGIATHRSTIDAQPTAIYTTDGRRLSSLQRGVNIVRMADGRTIKIVK